MTDREANEVIEFVRAFIAIDNAVCALKEREERSKGCEFCNIEANENTMIEDYGYVQKWYDALEYKARGKAN